MDSAVPLYQVGMWCWPISILFYPILNALAMWRFEKGLDVKGGVVFNSVMFLFFIIWE